MADLKYYDIISKPVITEKSMAGMEYKNIHFMYTQMRQKPRSRMLLRKCLPEQK